MTSKAFPPEVWTTIIDFACQPIGRRSFAYGTDCSPQQSITNLAQVNTSIHKDVLPFLYEEIGPKQLVDPRFQATILAKPHYAKMVKSVAWSMTAYVESGAGCNLDSATLAGLNTVQDVARARLQADVAASEPARKERLKQTLSLLSQFTDLRHLTLFFGCHYEDCFGFDLADAIALPSLAQLLAMPWKNTLETVTFPQMETDSYAGPEIPSLDVFVRFMKVCPRLTTLEMSTYIPQFLGNVAHFPVLKSLRVIPDIAAVNGWPQAEAAIYAAFVAAHSSTLQQLVIASGLSLLELTQNLLPHVTLPALQILILEDIIIDSQLIRGAQPSAATQLSWERLFSVIPACRDLRIHSEGEYKHELSGAKTDIITALLNSPVRHSLSNLVLSTDSAEASLDFSNLTTLFSLDSFPALRSVTLPTEIISKESLSPEEARFVASPYSWSNMILLKTAQVTRALAGREFRLEMRFPGPLADESVKELIYHNGNLQMSVY